MEKRILIFCIGTRENGMGHVVRCATLADALAARGLSPEFVTLQSTPGWTRLLKTKYVVRGYSETTPTDVIYNDARGYAAAIIDIEHGPQRATLERARECFPCVINIGGVGWAMNDADALDNLVDLQVYQSVLVDAPANDRRLVGVEYMIINPAFSKCMPDYEGGHVVVSMGGSDPHQLTDGAMGVPLSYFHNTKVIFGAATDYSGIRWATDGQDKRIQIYAPSPGKRCFLDLIFAPDSTVPYFVGAALSLIQLGMTAYESMAAGVPCLLVNLSEDHERTSVELERLGCAVNLGLWSEFEFASVRERVEWLLARPDELRRMGESGQALVDGKGAGRVADRIMDITT